MNTASATANRYHSRLIASACRELLEDIKATIRSRPRRLDWNQLDPNNIGWRLVHDNQSRYIGQKVAAWNLKLAPDQRHWDRRITVQLPDALKQAGAYLLVANLKDGNTARMIIWISDTAIVKKPVQKPGPVLCGRCGHRKAAGEHAG